MPSKKTAHCATCGKRKQLSYPKHAPLCCTQRCAAQYLLILFNVGAGAGRFCAACGEFGCEGECEE